MQIKATLTQMRTLRIAKTICRKPFLAPSFQTYLAAQASQLSWLKVLHGFQALPVTVLILQAIEGLFVARSRYVDHGIAQ
jgi:hypothetical protein